MASQYFNKKTFCVITGASQGFGRVMALRFSEKFGPGSRLLITARNEKNLESLKSEIESRFSNVSVFLFALDMCDPDETTYAEMIKSCLKGENVDSFELAYVIHNAGRLNDTSKPLVETSSVDELNKYFNLSLTSAFCLNCCFLRAVAGVEKKLILNVSSSAIKLPYPSAGLYCTVKAGRYMYFKCLAADEPSVRVLSYEPGAMRTALFYDVAQHSHSKELRESTTAMLEGTSSVPLLDPEQSTDKLMEILEQDTFVNGEQVDYYDDVAETFKTLHK